MEMIPKVVAENVASNAEKNIFNLLKKIDLHNNSVALHSLNCSEHQYKVWSEIDFCLVLPEGLFILEVKGGGVSVEDGLWTYKGHNRGGTSREGPFEQAKSARYSLEKILKEKFRLDRQLNNWPILFGYGVLLPDTPWTNLSVEMPSEIVADNQSCRDVKSFHQYIKHLIKYWQLKNKISSGMPLSKKEINLIKKALRPNIDFLPEFQIGLQTVRNQITQFTEEQFDIVDSSSSNQQLIVEGGAGTGKTFLAIQMARIDSKNGLSVLFVTESPILAELIERSETEPNLTVLSYDKLNRRGNAEAFDVLYVDEGQDLLSLQIFDEISPKLIGGLENGAWRWFMDPNHQSKLRGYFDPEALKVLRSGFNQKPFTQKLKNNVRNTKQIINFAEKSTGASLGKAKVELTADDPVLIKTSSKDLVSEVKRIIKSYVDKNVEYEDIGLIFSSTILDQNRRLICDAIKHYSHELSSLSLAASIRNKLLFGDARRFKGLEKPVIVAIGFDTRFIETSNMNEKYVAITRANYSITLVELDD